VGFEKITGTDPVAPAFRLVIRQVPEEAMQAHDAAAFTIGQGEGAQVMFNPSPARMLDLRGEQDEPTGRDIVLWGL
jgi:hypothetical protein